MTENEAIKLGKSLYNNITCNANNIIPTKEYIEFVGIAIQALERQIPKKVYHFTDDDTFETSCCGTDVTNEDYKYCPECGQLLGEVEEVIEHDRE